MNGAEEIMTKQRIFKADLQIIANYVYSSARENALVTVHENHTKAEIKEYGGGYADSHPAYWGYYLSSVEGVLGSLKNVREYRDYVPNYIKRPLTQKEIDVVKKMVFE